MNEEWLKEGDSIQYTDKKWYLIGGIHFYYAIKTPLNSGQYTWLTSKDVSLELTLVSLKDDMSWGECSKVNFEQAKTGVLATKTKKWKKIKISKNVDPFERSCLQEPWLCHCIEQGLRNAHKSAIDLKRKMEEAFK